jgi:MFS family permease
MAGAYLDKLRLFSRDVRLVLITAALLGFTVFGGIYPVLLNLYLLRLGHGPEFIGLVNAAFMLALGGFCLPAGGLGGRWGVRRMMIAGLCLVVAGYGLLPLAEFIPTTLQAGWVLASYLLGGLGLALYIVNANPFLMGTTSSEERSHAFSVQTALWPLAGFAGSLVGGLLPGLFASVLALSLDNPAPYRYPLWIAAVALIPAVVVMSATREIGSAHTQGTVADAGPAPYGLIALMALVVLLQVAGEGAARTFFNVYLDAGLHVPTAQIGVLSAAGQLLAVPAALATPLLMTRWGKERTFVLGSLGMALSLLPLALIPHWGAAGLGLMGMMALGSIARPANTVYHQEIVSPGWRAAMSGATTMAAGLSWSVMAFGGGYLITALGYRSLFLTGAGLTVAGALLFWAYFRVPRGELSSHSASGTTD